MSVTIVATLPQTGQTPSGDIAASNLAGADNLTGNQGFLSLLLAIGQQMSAPGALLSSGDAKSEKTSSDTSNTDTINADQINLFAALGITPSGNQPIAPNIALPEATNNDNSIRNAGEQNILIGGIGTTDTSVPNMPAPLETAKEKGDAQKAPDLNVTANEKILPTAQTLPQLTQSTPQILPQPTQSTPQILPEPPQNMQDKAAKIAADQTIVTGSDDRNGKYPSIDSVDSVDSANLTNQTLNVNNVFKTNVPTHDVPVAVQTQIHSQNWNQDFGQKIVWLATHDKQTAQITLNPEQMGPIQVSVNVDKGSATASFTSANAEVRDAIESALPRLREMFASAGINLGQTNVSAESFRQQTENDNGRSNQGASRDRGDAGILAVGSSSSASSGTYAMRIGKGMVDTFA